MKQYISLICTAIICITAIYIWQQYSKHNVYEYEMRRNEGSDIMLRINTNDGSVEMFNRREGWISFSLEP